MTRRQELESTYGVEPGWRNPHAGEVQGEMIYAPFYYDAGFNSGPGSKGIR